MPAKSFSSSSILWCCVFALLAGCGGGGSSSTGGPITAAPQSGATPFPPVALSADDWFTFAHDYKRTGFEPAKTAVSVQSVGGLKLRWSTMITPSGVAASPVAVDGMIFFSGLDGSVNALDPKTGDAGPLSWTLSALRRRAHPWPSNADIRRSSGIGFLS